MIRDMKKKMFKNFITFFKRDTFVIPLASIVLSLFIAALVILSIGKNPVIAYASLIKGSFGNVQAFITTMIKLTPLILTGLAVAFGFRAGLFNIGAEGQLSMGALAATMFGVYITSVPAIIAIPIAILGGMAAGGAWGAIAGYLKAKTGAHEVISTIMLNYIAALLANFMVNGPFQAVGTGIPKSPEITDAAKLPVMISVQASSLSIGIIISLIAAVIIYVIIQRTTVGYEIKAVGFNPYAAEYGGISIAKNIVLAMFISGALAGLAGTVEVLGLHHRFLGTLSAGKGFDGISIALIGQNNPIGVVFAALLIAALRTGSNQMQFAGIPKHIIIIVQGLVIFFIATERLVKTLILWKERKEEEVLQK